MNSSINIPTPCHEDWNGMEEQKDGRFCSSCKKVVVDFAKMNNAELQNYFSKNPSTGLCGNFHSAQISSSNLFQLYHFQIDRSKLFSGTKKISLFFLSILIFISGCRAHVRGRMIRTNEKGFQAKNSSSILKKL